MHVDAERWLVLHLTGQLFTALIVVSRVNL